MAKKRAWLYVVALLGMTCAGLIPHTHLAFAAPDGFMDPPAPAPLPWPADNPITDSEEVGTLPGSGTVTALGDYQFTLPLDVPPGRAGMAPSISLVYTSRGGSGTAGVGWGLSYGGSEITRCPQTFLHDGRTDSPNFSPSDALCLDGSRILVVNGGLPMAEGTEYRTFRDSFTRIVAHAGQAEAAGWFETFQKDGTIRQYHALSAKRWPPSPAVLPNGDPAEGDPPVSVTTVWVLTSVKDRTGNAIFYHYDVEPNDQPPYPFEYRISSIDYTAKVDATGDLLDAPSRRVVFEYSRPDERPDPTFHYQNGVRTGVTRRLMRVKLLAPNPVQEDAIGQYALGYEPDQERSFLASVHRLDDSGFRRMWARTFEWAHDDRPHFEVVDPPNLAGTYHETQPLLFDADNDGRDDLLLNGQFCRTTPGSLVPFNACVPAPGIWGRPADVNGDGKVDVLRKSAADPIAFSTWNSLTGSFESLDYGLAPNSNLIDADGDGLIDAYVIGPRRNPQHDFYEHEWYLRLNTGNGFADPVAPMFPAPFMIGRKSIALDLDGNGRGELHTGFHPQQEEPRDPDDTGPHAPTSPPRECALWPRPPWQYSALGLTDGGTITSDVMIPAGSTCRKVFLDFNGDGLKDIVMAGEQGPIIRYNTGTQFLPAEPLGGQFYPRLGRHEFEVGDVDGDGREDLISSKEASSFHGLDHVGDTYLHLARPGRFTALNLGAAPYQIPGDNVEDLSPKIQDLSPVVKISDVNGDGLADLVVVLRDRSEDTSKVRVLLQQWQPKDVITHVWDEHSPKPRESVFYSPFTTDNPSPATCQYPTRCIRGGMTVAREHWIHRQDEPSAIRRTAYEFDDPRTDLRGRRYLGFGKVRTTDLDSFAQTITFFDHTTVDGGRYPFAGLPGETWRITPILTTSPDAAGGVKLPGPGGVITARVSHTYHQHERRSTNGGVTYVVFPLGSDTEEWEQPVEFQPAGLALVGNITPFRGTHTTRQFDDFGTELFSAAWTEGGQRCEITTVPQNDPVSWLLGLPVSTAVTCNKDGLQLPEPRLQTMGYDHRGLLQTVTVEPNHPELKTTTTFTRNDHGLVTLITVTAQGEIPRKTFVAYDEEGLFPRATWNVLGHTNRQLVHPAYGVPILAEDVNGVQVRYRYDGFGRIREVDPDDASGGLVSYQQDEEFPWGLRVIETREDGGAAETLMDEWGRTLTSATLGFDGRWIHERIGYNLFGQATETYRPAIEEAPSLKTVTTFDTLGRPVRIEAPNGAVTSIDHSMFETVTTDAEHRQSKITRDVDNRVSETADRWKQQWLTTSYLYGPFGNVEDAVDPVGNVIHATVDKIGRRTSLHDPDRGTTFWTYNAYGEVESEVDALGDTTLFFRDHVGRLTSSIHDTYGITTYTYDGIGAKGEHNQLTRMASPDVITTHDYDGMGRNTKTRWTIGTDTYEIQQSYDEYSRLETLRYPLAPGREPFLAKYAYNAYGYESRVSDAADKVLWEIGSRSADGLLQETSTGNGFDEARQYDPSTGQLTNVEAVKNGTALYSVHYIRDLTGNIRQREDHAPGAHRTETFRYDELDRLEHWVLETENEQWKTKYVYDVLGNLTQVQRDSGVEQRTYDGDLPHALMTRAVAAVGTSYSYDERGRQRAGGGREISWTPFDLPTEIRQGAEVTTFSYDALGRRVRKVRELGGTFVEGVDTIAGLYERRYKAGQSPQHAFTAHGTDGPVAQVVYTEGGAEPEKTLYLHQEALSSVGLVTDNQGDEVERSYFDPFGEKTDVVGDVTSPMLGDVKLGFTGHRHDDELGLIDMKGRIYDPAQKRFLTPDPYIPDPLSGQSYNRYSYVVNNPMRYTDPTGFLPAPNLCVGATCFFQRLESMFSNGAQAPDPRDFVTPDGVVVHITAKADDAGNKNGDTILDETTTGDSAKDKARIAAQNKARARQLGLEQWRRDTWKENSLVQGISGFIAGASLGTVPYAALAMGVAGDANWIGEGTREANIGRGLGEIVGGLLTFSTGTGGAVGGGALTTTGAGAGPGIPLMVVSAELAVGGLANVAAGWAHLEIALSQASGPVGGGGSWPSRPVGHPSCQSGCESAAEEIQKAIGGDIKVIKPPTNAVFLGKVRDAPGEPFKRPGGDLALGWSDHHVVVKDGRVYDRLTGSQGQSIADYKARWEFSDAINFGF